MKPLGHKSYGSIGHLPNSRMGSGDHHVPQGQADICFGKVIRKGDYIIIQEKLDGSNVSVANIDGNLVALGRAGHLAISSPWEQHRLFANWLLENLSLFEFLKPGERCCGEWLAQAHGTRYVLPHEPFVPFDIMRNGHERATHQEFCERVPPSLTSPMVVSFRGKPMPIEEAYARLVSEYHGSLDPIEGLVYRVENNGKVDFLAKYVRPDKVDGLYLPEVSGKPAHWNWRPE